MTMTMETALFNNQSILQNFGLVEEIDEQAAEIISGGKKFTIANNTSNDVFYTLDSAVWCIAPGKTQNFDTDYGGTIGFDRDIRPDDISVGRKYLEDGHKYEFRPDISGCGNSYNIDLYEICSPPPC
ncbi:hypothetical protein [Nostoc sp.]|uniref:hypothetical protein n=1 Tax=Nostoc sp. TaxID=1180 RepID=UPI002FF4945E